jgi:hypothetical protein
VNEIWVWRVGGITATGRSGVFGEKCFPLPFCPLQAYMVGSVIEPEPPLRQAAIKCLGHGTTALRGRLLTYGCTAVGSVLNVAA